MTLRYRSALTLTLLAAALGAVAPGLRGQDQALPFIDDDYARARAEARARRLPLFIEAWAPW